MYCNCRCYYSRFIKKWSVLWGTAKVNLIPCLSHLQSKLFASIIFCNIEPSTRTLCIARNKYLLLSFQVCLLIIKRVSWSCFMGKGRRSAGWSHLHYCVLLLPLLMLSSKFNCPDNIFSLYQSSSSLHASCIFVALWIDIFRYHSSVLLGARWFVVQTHSSLSYWRSSEVPASGT